MKPNTESNMENVPFQPNNPSRIHRQSCFKIQSLYKRWKMILLITMIIVIIIALVIIYLYSNKNEKSKTFENPPITNTSLFPNNVNRVQNNINYEIKTLNSATSGTTQDTPDNEMEIENNISSIVTIKYSTILDDSFSETMKSLGNSKASNVAVHVHSFSAINEGNS